MPDPAFDAFDPFGPTYAQPTGTPPYTPYGEPWPPAPFEVGAQALEPEITAPPAEPVTDSIDAGDHVAHGTKSMILPAIAGGALAGLLAASAAPQGLKGLAFGGKFTGQLIGGIATGAAMGLLVGATSPKPGEDLRPRYALAGAAAGAAGGALFPGGSSRAFCIALGTAASAIMGWIIGGKAPGHPSE